MGDHMEEKNPPNTIKKAMRYLAGLAHEAERARALEGLFQGWKSGEMDSFELSDPIHAFHNGPSRKIYLRYTGLDSPLLVECALANGLIPEAAVPKEVRPYLKRFPDLSRPGRTTEI